MGKVRLFARHNLRRQYLFVGLLMLLRYSPLYNVSNCILRMAINSKFWRGERALEFFDLEKVPS